jgi:hypothetical protein
MVVIRFVEHLSTGSRYATIFIRGVHLLIGRPHRGPKGAAPSKHSHRGFQPRPIFIRPLSGRCALRAPDRISRIEPSTGVRYAHEAAWPPERGALRQVRQSLTALGAAEPRECLNISRPYGTDNRSHGTLPGLKPWAILGGPYGTRRTAIEGRDTLGRRAPALAETETPPAAVR